MLPAALPSWACAVLGGLAQGLALRGDLAAALGLAGLALQCAAVLAARDRAWPQLLGGLLVAQALAMSWLWGAAFNGAGDAALWVAAAPLAVHLLVLATGALFTWGALAGLRGTRQVSRGERALRWWAAVTVADLLRRATPWGGDYGSPSLLMADLPGAAAWLPLAGAQLCAVAWTGCMALAALLARRAWQRRPSRRLAAGLAAGVAVWVLGALGPGIEWTEPRALPVSLAAVRPPDAGAAWGVATRDARVQQLLDAARARPPGAVLVTSEGFFGEPPPPEPEGLWLDLVDGLARRDVHALVGMQLLARGEQRAGAVNAVVQLSPQRVAVYGKGLLAPGGEALPWYGLLQPVYQRAFSQADGAVLSAPDAWREPLFVGGTAMSLALCHEVAFDADMARRTRDAQLLLNPADDTWTSHPVYARQVLAMARLRAMESGKPLLRVSEGGTSALVSARGAVLPLTAPAATLEVIARDGRTPYGALAEALALLPWAVPLAALAWAVHARARGGRRVQEPRQ